MATNNERERGIGYPKLTAEQINLVIDQLIFAVRQRDLGASLDLAEETASHLVGFYTRRWGMPPAIVGRIERIRELAAGIEPPSSPTGR
jgi:hypothetical protein